MIHNVAFRMLTWDHWARHMRVNVHYLPRPSWRQRAGYSVVGMQQGKNTLGNISLQVISVSSPQATPAGRLR